MIPGGRAVTRFDADDVATPQGLLRALNEYAAAEAQRLSALEAFRFVVLADVLFETAGSIGVNTSPFPLRVQTPFAISGAWVVLCENTVTGESGITNSGVSAWVRPVSGTPDGEGNAVEIQLVTGLTTNSKYRLRLAVVGVKNG